MAETPEERLARLRREVEGSWSPPAEPTPSAPPGPGLTDPAPIPGPSAPARPISEPLEVEGPLDPKDPLPAASSVSASLPAATTDEPPPSSRPATPPLPATSPDDGWSVADALGGASLGQWVAIGLVAVGGYLVLAFFIPGIAFPGSLAMTALGVILLWQHLAHRLGAWALYAGAILTAIGALRVIGDLLPFNVDGETSLGLGLALVSIGWLRHTQAGGWGWQGAVGVVALGWGAIQLVLGLLPGSPGLLDLVLPALLLVGGLWLLVRTSRDGHKNG
jgi:hypothetical protein